MKFSLLLLLFQTFPLASGLYKCIPFLVAEDKPALDPNVEKAWTLSANDMDDDDVVCVWLYLCVDL